MDMTEQAMLEAQAAELEAHGRSLADGRWGEYLEGLEDDWTRAYTAVLLENQDTHLAEQKCAAYDLSLPQLRQLEETTTISTPGLANFEKFAFPLIRAIFPNLVSSNLVSVQPMTGPSSMIFYLAFLYGSNKGTAVKGTDIWENPKPSYSSEEIDSETFGTGTGSEDVFTGDLSYVPIRKNTLTVTADTVTGTDDGAGNITGTGVDSGTINYTTGAISIDFTANVSTGVPVTASYEYDMEANPQIPEVDLVLTSSPVVAHPRKLRSRWSMEAAAHMRNLHGLDPETELSAVLAEELKFEIDREIIAQLNVVASAGIVEFDKTPASGVSWQDHKQTFVDRMVEAGNKVFAKTRRAQTNWIVMGTDVATIVESLPGFVPSGVTGTMGVVYTGVLQGRWKCYKDPYMAPTRFLTGFKGSSFLETGYVYAPYIPLYVTPTVTLDDFVVRKGLGTWYGKKVVNSRFYCKGVVTASAS
jgi:hypothetical protein